MSYRVELHATALAQIKGLPPEAFDALVTALADAATTPWDTMAMRPNEPEYRQAIFGTFGLVSFYVDEPAEVLRVFDITWTG
ncbi:type II toxin-antitoxin system RelE family toxin [Thermomonospora amylolytica]|uniref:type II toxin-antitoxin system RelE family toxin n=1 Tax=Thermomonospora amylolytica TaxID=1411117 RepID=UPI000E6C9CCD|nr:hypothetical protein [Thermomonospora amylolytica]